MNKLILCVALLAAVAVGKLTLTGTEGQENPKLCEGGVRLGEGAYPWDGPTSKPFNWTIQLGGGYITLYNVHVDGGYIYGGFDAVDVDVDQIVMKGGKNGAYFFSFDDTVSEAGGTTGGYTGFLYTPDTASGKAAGISHIDICIHYHVKVEFDPAAKGLATYDELYDWTISHASPDNGKHLELAKDQNYAVPFTWEATHKVDFQDEVLAGTIVISNPDFNRANVHEGSSVAIDTVFTYGGVPVPLSCKLNGTGEAFDLTNGHVLAPLDRLVCTFRVVFDTQDISTLNKELVLDVNVPAGSKIQDAEAIKADIVFARDQYIDECASVFSTLLNAVVDADLCVGEPLTGSFTYALPTYLCGPGELTSVMKLTEKDTNTLRTSLPLGLSWETICDEAGCTLTQGYWKTHADPLNEKKYDDTWDNLEEGSATTFFLSGKSYLEILQTPPAGGNVYLQLAHQWIAALLNGFNGAASDPDIKASITWGKEFFKAGGVGDLDIARAHASALDDYNNGRTGPGHCDDNSPL